MGMSGGSKGGGGISQFMGTPGGQAIGRAIGSKFGGGAPQTQGPAMTPGGVPNQRVMDEANLASRQAAAAGGALPPSPGPEPALPPPSAPAGLAGLAAAQQAAPVGGFQPSGPISWSPTQAPAAPAAGLPAIVQQARQPYVAQNYNIQPPSMAPTRVAAAQPTNQYPGMVTMQKNGKTYVKPRGEFGAGWRPAGPVHNPNFAGGGGRSLDTSGQATGGRSYGGASRGLW